MAVLPRNFHPSLHPKLVTEERGKEASTSSECNLHPAESVILARGAPSPSPTPLPISGQVVAPTSAWGEAQ